MKNLNQRERTDNLYNTYRRTVRAAWNRSDPRMMEKARHLRSQWENIISGTQEEADRVLREVELETIVEEVGGSVKTIVIKGVR